MEGWGEGVCVYGVVWVGSGEGGRSVVRWEGVWWSKNFARARENFAPTTRARENEPKMTPPIITI